jgi:hypothetical protein
MGDGSRVCSAGVARPLFSGSSRAVGPLVTSFAPGLVSLIQLLGQPMRRSIRSTEYSAHVKGTVSEHLVKNKCIVFYDVVGRSK